MCAPYERYDIACALREWRRRLMRLAVPGNCSEPRTTNRFRSLPATPQTREELNRWMRCTHVSKPHRRYQFYSFDAGAVHWVAIDTEVYDDKIFKCGQPRADAPPAAATVTCGAPRGSTGGAKT